jgi:hypothetical protein
MAARAVEPCVRGDVEQIEMTPQVEDGFSLVEDCARICANILDRHHHSLRVLKVCLLPVVAVAHIEDDHERHHGTRAGKRISIDFAEVHPLPPG